MKILFLVDSLDAGGAGRVVSQLANQMALNGYQVFVATLFENQVSYKIAINVVHVPLAAGMLTDSYLKRVHRIRDVAKKNHIEIVISLLTNINVYAIFAGFFSSWKTIISERNDPNRNPKSKRVRIFRNFFYTFADGFVFQTEDAKGYFSKAIQRRGIVIFNPICDSFPQPFEGTRSKRIVSVGRLVPQKNFPMAIEAFAQIAEKYSDYIYEIFGEGKEQANLKQLICDKKLESRVFLRGQRLNVFDEIIDATLFVMSSDYEGMSNALIEALALGLPTISTDHPIGGAKMLIEDSVNGILIPVGDSKALASKMDLLIGDKKKAYELGKQTQSIRKMLSIEHIADEWLNYIRTHIPHPLGPK
ncbi:MAG: glycosyltransferase [Peptostreptococcaceae bacterium]|nr:glycosyltransferase [Peptostreptococcaceae bacterium]